uniref:BACK domain-containing protein n=1 Tax=Caenorhabditis tropicalis TaxID=1561998 RepID=A0A1I7TBJ4_9PELO
MSSQRQVSEPTVILSLNNGYLIKMRHSDLQTHTQKFQPSEESISMARFDVTCVRQVVEWMFSRELIVNYDNYIHFYMIAEFLEAPGLRKKIIEQVATDPELAIMLFNRFAGKKVKATKPQKTFSPFCTLFQLSNTSLDYMAEILNAVAPKLTNDQVRKLPIKSIYALMIARLPVEKKAQLVFLTMDWIALTKPSRNTVYSILQSLYITNCQKMYNLEHLRTHMLWYLTKLYSTSSKLLIYPNGYSQILEAPKAEIDVIPPETIRYDTYRDPINGMLGKEMRSGKPPILKAPFKMDRQIRATHWSYQKRGDIPVEPPTPRGNPLPKFEGKTYEYYASPYFTSTVTNTFFFSYGID